jgi:hypothetical protein
LSNANCVLLRPASSSVARKAFAAATIFVVASAGDAGPPCGAASNRTTGATTARLTTNARTVLVM